VARRTAFALRARVAGVQVRHLYDGHQVLHQFCPPPSLGIGKLAQRKRSRRSHRIDHEEFWSRHDFGDLTHASEVLRRWEHAYNHERFSLALQGRTPIEKLTAASQPPAAA